MITSCKEDEVSVTVKTYHVEKVTASTGDIRGTVKVSNAELVEAGICYAPGYSYPSLTNSKSHSVPATGDLTDFVVHLSGLSSDSTYYFRAYARTKDTSYYGIIYSFTPVAIPVDLVFVEGGTFSMGATAEQVGASADEWPVSSVTLGDYRIGRKEVTVAEFVRFLNSRHVASTGTSMTSFGSSLMILPAPKNVYYEEDSDLWASQKGYDTSFIM
jgi:formylglycine-generating enzyme required for sulfatase activity